MATASALAGGSLDSLASAEELLAPGDAVTQVLENYSDAPMTPKQILQVIEAEGLKEMSGTSPLACLNAMLHSNSRGGDGLFYKLPGRISLFTLKKDALQWSRNLSVPEGEELEDTADAESCESNEASTVSGDNDVSLDETSSNASCSTESQSKGPAAARESCRTASQTTKQKKKTGVMLPRVVLTPLKVNGAHMESASGFTGRHADGESSSTSSSSSSSLALCKATLRSRTEINRDPPQLLRGIRKPTAGQMKRNRGEDIDFETPGSILVNTNLRALINSRTFNALPSHFQQQLLYLLPEVDRQVGADGLMRLSGSALNNEFFTHAAQSWRERLADGEFTHEMQVRIRQEMEKEKRVEQWKEKFFEDYYGQKLGLTQEESQEQNLVQEDAENRTGLSVKGEARLPRGPSTRQRDGHFKKRSRADLRCRARRSLYKLREPEPAEAAKEAASVGPDSSLHKETKPEIDLKKDDLTSPSAAVLKPESSELHLSPETSKLHSKSEDLPLAAANRIPSLPQENSAREAKDQKRKCFEEAASASFPEKKPRLEDRQSFRNTIESVHPEKPQPTKEEPKVPPIRIQLSRIKPPWVVKGQPAYQICPRIIPSTEPSGRGRAGARTLADIKARALQARAQREAATAAIGGGGGPGGGRSPDEGGGGEPSSRSERRRSKRTRGKRSSDLQRAQLLSPVHLSGAGANPGGAARGDATNSFPSSRQDPFSSKSEGSGDLERAAGRSSGEARPGGASPRRQFCDALTGPSLGSATSERQEESPEQLLCHPRTETPPCAASQERQSTKPKHAVPLVNGLSCSRVQGAALGPTGDGLVSELRAVRAPAGQLDYRSDLKENSPSCPALLPELSSGGEECHEPETVSRFRFNGSEMLVEKCVADSDRSKAGTAGVEEAAPALCDVARLQAERGSGGKLSSEEQNAESLLKPSSHDDFSSQNRGDTPEQPQPRERCPRAEPESARPPLGEAQEFKTNGDDEIESTHSETTDTASDFEADESVGMDVYCGSVSCREAAGKDSSCPSSTERCDGIRSKAAGEGDSLAYVVDCPAVAVKSPPPPPQRWGPAAPPPQAAERPTGSARPVASGETTNPLVMQLLKGNLPLEEVLPVSHANIKLEMAQPLPDTWSENLSLQMERGSGCYFGKESSPDVGVKTSAQSRSDDFPSMGSSVDPQEKERGSGAALLGAEEAEDQSIPEKHSKGGSTLSCQDQRANVASASQPEDTGPRERTFSSCSFEEQKELSTVHRVPQHKPLTSVITSNSPEKLNISMEPQFLSPAVTSLGPNQTGGASVNKNYVGVQGKKLFGSGFPCSPAVRLHHARALDQVSAAGTSSPSKQVPLPKGCAAGGAPAPREGWAPKQHADALGGGRNENVLACGSPGKSNVENQKDVAQSPAELAEHLQSVPLVMDLPFFKFSREPGKGHNHPLEPSSIPSQLNIKQAFYGKLSKLQLNSTSFNYSSNTPAFPRSLAGSMMQLTHKANFAANRNSSLSVQMFADSGSVDEISFKCSCSLKAMIMCKGCGAFCHDDCIGPSKLCVLCLVVR